MDARIDGLVNDVQSGALSRRKFFERAGALGVGTGAALALLNEPADAARRRRRRRRAAAANGDVAPKKWRKGRGWGWVWGSDDEVGALNELSPELAKKGLSYGKGRVYDLGQAYDKRSFKFAGHAAGEIVTYRSPEGLILQKDPVVTGPGNTSVTSYASCLNSISDNVATQIDGLGHIYIGREPRAYNGFKSEDIVGDYGLLKLGVETIPPIVVPATLIDVAGYLKRDPALPAGFDIGVDLIRETLAHQKVDVDVLDAVFIRTGTGKVWLAGDKVGADQEEMKKYDPAGITVAAARWLVEEKGALLVGSDTTGLEVVPPVDQVPGEGTSFNPVHVYLLVKQGVHIGEVLNLEDLAKDNVYKFGLVWSPNKIKGNVAGTVQRPVALA